MNIKDGQREVITDKLDRAAFLITMGAKLTDLQGAYPNYTFTLLINKEIIVKESRSELVNYKVFCANRQWLKHGGGRLNIPIDSTMQARVKQLQEQQYQLKDFAKITQK